MTELFVVRHGNTDWNTLGKIQGRIDIPLNQRGQAQAKCCADYLSKQNWDVLLTSPLKRAKETAEIINTQLHINEFHVIEEFTERDYGEASTMLFSDLKNVQYETIPGMESESKIIERVNNGLFKVNKEFKDKRIILVSHGITINTLLHIASNREYQINTIQLQNGCLNSFIFKNNVWRIEQFNMTNHLKKNLLTR